MKCIISGVNIKIFARAIHALARIGDELYVEPGPEGVSFHTVNSSRSAFSSFVFGEQFFVQYDVGIAPNNAVTPGPSKASDVTVQSEAIKCKVAMKAFLNAFKSLASVEKNVERCKMTLDGSAAKLLLQLWCRHSVVRTYNLAFIECETLKAIIDEEACIHRITSQAKLLSDVFVNFQQSQDQVSLTVNQNVTIVKNYVDDEPDPSKVIRTELQLEVDEFDEYNIDARGTEVVFCLKELRALLGFAEPIHLPVTALFSQPGSPIIFRVENNPFYVCKFVLATLTSATNDSQCTTVPTQSKNVQRAQSAGNTTTKEDVTISNRSLQPERSAHHLDANDNVPPKSVSTQRAQFSNNSHDNVPTPSRIPQCEQSDNYNNNDSVHNLSFRPIEDKTSQRPQSCYNMEVIDTVPINNFNDHSFRPSPPRKKKRNNWLLKQYLNPGHYAKPMPGSNVVLAPDSDTEG